MTFRSHAVIRHGKRTRNTAQLVPAPQRAKRQVKRTIERKKLPLKATAFR
jgi:hypothetical protein